MRIVTQEARREEVISPAGSAMRCEEMARVDSEKSCRFVGAGSSVESAVGERSHSRERGGRGKVIYIST